MDTNKHVLTIIYNDVHSFWKVTCPEGDYVTSFNPDTDDPKDYYAGKEVYLPKFFTEDEIAARYRCVTEEENATFIAARDRAMDEYEAQRLKDESRPVFEE